MFHARIHTALPGLLVLLLIPMTARAHPLVENALDIVISPDKVVIDARIALEEVLLVDANGGSKPPRERWGDAVAAHGPYLLKHLRLNVDGVFVEGTLVSFAIDDAASVSSMAAYRLEYPLPGLPRGVWLDQSLLREFDPWTASCIVRIRQSNQPSFDTALLTREKKLEFGCAWDAAAPDHPMVVAPGNIRTEVKLGPTIRAYARLGILHILTGYDHLLFVSALILAATRLWDLIKVVTAFTLAHTLTLTLSVLQLVSLGRLAGWVEPMISASIVFVAVQNIFWPQRSRGWSRLAIAFGFGLFHGLGFAGGLQEAMRGMPPLALWAALAAFSIGVEIGHQVVVLPLFVALQLARHWNTNVPRAALMGGILRFGSSAIAAAGVYFLVQAFR